jgi:hypothetical protein
MFFFQALAGGTYSYHCVLKGSNASKLRCNVDRLHRIIVMFLYKNYVRNMRAFHIFKLLESNSAGANEPPLCAPAELVIRMQFLYSLFQCVYILYTPSLHCRYRKCVSFFVIKY